MKQIDHRAALTAAIHAAEIEAGFIAEDLWPRRLNPLSAPVAEVLVGQVIGEIVHELEGLCALLSHPKLGVGSPFEGGLLSSIEVLEKGIDTLRASRTNPGWKAPDALLGFVNDLAREAKTSGLGEARLAIYRAFGL